MKITKIGSDYVNINEDNIKDVYLLNIPRIHIIKLSFINPTEDKINSVMSLFPRTNRYVISNNIREYNYVLRNTSKKYYIENLPGTDFISFFRKNNKVLLNFNNLSIFEKRFIISTCFEDALRNIEVIQLDKRTFEETEIILNKWNGNVIISDNVM